MSSSGDKDPKKKASSDDINDRRQLAEDRTEWAEQRTLMAKERTFAAWMRTGLAMTATGLGFGQLLRELDPNWAVKTMAAIMVAAAVATFVLGFWRHKKVSKELEYSGMKRTPLWTLAAIALALIVASGLGLIAVLL
ncbi:MAG: YidH family protein [Limisphaerales bacterium]